MASGRAHHGLTILITIIAPAGMLAVGQPWDKAAALGVGALAGVFLTPDLDVHNPVHAHYLAAESLGCLAGAAWRWLWIPYARIIPRHRHPLSHWPLLGTVGRLLYMLIPLWVLGWHWWPLPWWLIWGAYGLALADLGHWFLDLKPVGPLKVGLVK